MFTDNISAAHCMHAYFITASFTGNSLPSINFSGARKSLHILFDHLKQSFRSSGWCVFFKSVVCFKYFNIIISCKSPGCNFSQFKKKIYTE